MKYNPDENYHARNWLNRVQGYLSTRLNTFEYSFEELVANSDAIQICIALHSILSSEEYLHTVINRHKPIHIEVDHPEWT
jgi:hypothetical protein